MKYTGYVRYDLTMEKKVKAKGDDYTRVPVRVTGIVEDTPQIIGHIFQQHPEALPCVAIIKEEYYPIYI